MIKILTLFFSLLFYNIPCLAQQTNYIIGFPEDNMSNDWRAAQMKELQSEFAGNKHVKFLSADAQGSISRNILDIEDMVERGAQLLFLGPQDPEAISPIAARLRKQGVRIILLTRKLNSDDYDVYISPDDFKIGQDAAHFLASHLGKAGTILMLEGISSTSTAMQRKKGFLSAITRYSGITVISRTANYSRTDAIMAVEELLNEGVKFDAIYAHNDAMAAGARFALLQAGIKPASIPTVGIDFLPETRTAIQNGEQLASFTYPTCGKVGAKVAIDLLNGKTLPRYIPVPYQLVTKKNADKVNTAY